MEDENPEDKSNSNIFGWIVTRSDSILSREIDEVEIFSHLVSELFIMPVL